MRRGRIKYVRRRRKRLSLPTVFFAAAFLAFLIWMFASANPFEQANPFLKEVTIGQAVLGDWRYGGADAVHLKFYDTYQSIPIPANSKTFAADGEFVSIISHTPSTLTFEPVIESEVMQPMVYVWVFLLLGALVWALVKNRKMRPKRQFKT